LALPLVAAQAPVQRRPRKAWRIKSADGCNQPGSWALGARSRRPTRLATRCRPRSCFGRGSSLVVPSPTTGFEGSLSWRWTRAVSRRTEPNNRLQRLVELAMPVRKYPVCGVAFLPRFSAYRCVACVARSSAPCTWGISERARKRCPLGRIACFAEIDRKCDRTLNFKMDST